MISTRTNPAYTCGDHFWTSSPITLVESDDLVLPNCPSCDEPLRLMGFLEQFSHDFGGEFDYDPYIAAAIDQDSNAEMRKQVKERYTDKMRVRDENDG